MITPISSSVASGIIATSTRIVLHFPGYDIYKSGYQGFGFFLGNISITRDSTPDVPGKQWMMGQ